MRVFIILLSAFVLYLLQGYLYKKFWDYQLRLDIKFQSSTAFEGEKLALTEVLSNNKLLPLPWVKVKFQISRDLVFPDNANAKVTDYYYRNDLFSIIMRQRITRTIPFVCTKRGYYYIKSADVLSSNILGNDKYVYRADCGTHLTVYPAIIDLGRLEIPFRRLNGSIAARRFLNPDPFEFRGIRQYQPSDSLKSVNFKASARAGALMSNEYDYTVSQEVVIILNLQKYAQQTVDDLFEASIHIAGSIADYYTTAGVSISLYANGRDVVTGEEIHISSGSGERHLENILEALAHVDLLKEIAPVTLILSDIINSGLSEPVYILISPYHENDMLEMYEEIRQMSFDSALIVPVFKYAKEESALADDVIKWEV